ncbi:GNAT family N-acetyltransferase [Halorussus marinus]|uniref:GNAT family N-acetyltransferase n=1 Tax=Halorussus marinus TaxID=2505976 RepID=UPI00109235BE|nr:GNAT family N-acetyltransferase [Halorussus marinus]
MTVQSQAKAQLTAERCADPEAWDAFVARNDGSPFALWGWGDAVETYGHDRWYVVAKDGDRIVGGVPLFYVRSRLFGSKLVSPPFGERGSILLADGTDDDVASFLLERTKELAEALDVDFVSLRGGDTDARRGFEERTRFVTFRAPVASADDAWERIKESRRRQITQAADSEMVHDVGDSLADLREYYRLYLRSVRGHGSPPHSFAFFRTLWETLGESGNLRMEMLRKDGVLVNAVINLALGSTVTQWGVVNDYEYRDLNGGSLLVWKSMEWAAESDYDAYEFGRTREGSGVYMFKKSFGGEKTWYSDLHYFPNPSAELPHPEKDAYEPVKDVWKKLPIPVTRLVGPHLRQSISL